MHLSAEINYPGASPELVFTMVTDRVFQELKCAATGSLAYEVQVQAYADDTAGIITHRALPTDDVPEFVRRFVGGNGSRGRAPRLAGAPTVRAVDSARSWSRSAAFRCG